jgi:hypothetical protein
VAGLSRRCATKAPGFKCIGFRLHTSDTTQFFVALGTTRCVQTSATGHTHTHTHNHNHTPVQHGPTPGCRNCVPLWSVLHWGVSTGVFGDPLVLLVDEMCTDGGIRVREITRSCSVMVIKCSGHGQISQKTQQSRPDDCHSCNCTCTITQGYSE